MITDEANTDRFCGLLQNVPTSSLQNKWSPLFHGWEETKDMEETMDQWTIPGPKEKVCAGENIQQSKQRLS